MTDYTNGRPFLITQSESLGDRSNRVSYLFPDGSRRGVILDSALDTPELRRKIGEAWAQGRTSIVKKGRK